MIGAVPRGGHTGLNLHVWNEIGYEPHWRPNRPFPLDNSKREFLCHYPGITPAITTTAPGLLLFLLLIPGDTV